VEAHLVVSDPFVRNLPSRAVVVAAAIVLFAPWVEAASLDVGPPEQIAPGWTRITGRYESAGAEPEFRAIAGCGNSQTDAHILATVVHLAPTGGTVWLDLPGTPDRLVPASTPCELPHVSVEMLVGGTVVGTAPIARRDTAASNLLVAPPPAPVRPVSSFSLKGQKYSDAPFAKRTEAGVQWAVDPHVSIEFNYERTAQAPLMPFDHDDGFLTRLRVGF
jgi:hypothetical protein